MSKKAKVLYLDIENSRMIVEFPTYSLYNIDRIHPKHIKHDWYITCAAWAWLDNKTRKVGKILGAKTSDFKSYKKDFRNDLGIVKELHKVMSEADLIVGHNCMEENSLVLKADYTWDKVKNLKPGDKIVGFEEGLAPGKSLRKKGKWQGIGRTRQYKESTVISNYQKLEECVEVLLSNGERVITSKDHFWLAQTKKDNYNKWISSVDLKPGYRIKKLFNTWEKDTSYEAGWLSGFLDGEGTINKGSGKTISFCQRPGPVWDRAIEFSKKLGLKLSGRKLLKPSGIGKQDCLYSGFLGNKAEMAEIIGKLDIKKFKKDLNWDNFGSVTKGVEKVKVVSVTNVGTRTINVMSTDTKTFIGEGYPMHNCDAFDIKKINYRFIKHGLEPIDLPPTVDTLKAARKYAKASSNSLYYLAKEFGVPMKIDLPSGVMHAADEGCQKSLDKLFRYCKGDIKAGASLYFKLLPYIKNHPNLNRIIGDQEKTYPEKVDACGSCGSKKIIKNGYRATKTGRRQRYICQDCGSSTIGAKK